MRILPIVMSTESIRNIDRKTMTRRVIKEKNCPDLFPIKRVFNDPPIGAMYVGGIIKPKYQPGDILYVKETFMPISDDISSSYLYKADANNPTPDEQGNVYSSDGKAFKLKWHSPRFMPKEAARFWFEVIAVKIERLQDISEEDAMKEGVGDLFMDYIAFSGDKRCEGMHDPTNPDIARLQYQLLWDRLNAKRGYPWANNDWVFAYTLKRTVKPE